MPDRHTRILERTPTSREEVARTQAAYFLLTGVWPIVHMRSFEWITGRKVDDWPVKTLGGLLGAFGVILARSSASPPLQPEMRRLAIASAGVLAASDVIYVFRGRIRPVYLLDAAANLALAGSMLLARPQAGEEDR